MDADTARYASTGALEREAVLLKNDIDLLTEQELKLLEIVEEILEVRKCASSKDNYPF